MAKTTTAKTSYSKDFLDQVKKALLVEKEKLEQELNKIGSKDPNKIDAEFPDYGSAEDENAAEVADYIANLNVEESLQKSLRDVNISLERIDKGTYGICKYCKKPIEEKRLLARPTSSACVECKKAIVQEA